MAAEPRRLMTDEEKAESRRAATRRWRERNRELTRAYAKTKQQDRNEWNRRFRSENPGFDTARKREYVARNRERARALGRKHAAERAARRANAKMVPFTLEEAAARVAFFGGRCWMCGGEWTALDHVKPLSKGGPHMLANLRPACMPCNSRKYNKWPFDTTVHRGVGQAVRDVANENVMRATTGR